MQTNTQILTFNQPYTSKEVKIGCCLERVKQYVPVPLGCFKCPKYGHQKEACRRRRRRQASAKCGEKDPDYLEEDCLKQIRCANCQDHPVYVRSYRVYKKEKKILEVKHKRMCPSWKRGKQRVDTTNQDNKYRTLVEKLIQLE